MSEVLAAGGLLWRDGPGGVGEVAVVHRPRYDDWSLPKGKRDGAEPLAATAAREVTEETGFRAILGHRLPATRYRVLAGEKIVHYWAARCISGTFSPNEEVDELRWVNAAAATDLLSYPHDRALLTYLPRAAAVRATLLLVRHAKAGKRSEWGLPDELRPLSPVGWSQAEALRRLLPLFGPQRVHSAPRTRCSQTVQALATDMGVPIVEEPQLSEEGYWQDPAAGSRRVEAIAAGPGGTAVVCSQGGVIPDVVGTLLGPAAAAERTLRSRKGSLWVLSFTRDGRGPLRLMAADHHPDPAL